MATYTLVKFKKMTPLHMGTGKENYDFSATGLQSDTLSAALAAMKVQSGDCSDLKAFLDSFVISSAFPYIGNHYFLPKPQGKIEIEVSDGDEYASKKKLKKLKFIELDVWNDLIECKKMTVKEKQIQDKFLLADISGTYFNKPYVSQVNQRVSIPHEEGKDADPFFFEWIYFNADSGLYCLLDAPEDKLSELIRLFELLGESGLGTDRNIGGGKFEIETDTLSIPDVCSADSVMLLSLFIPTEDDVSKLNLSSSCYELLQRGGYISGSQEVDFRHLRKKSIYMFNVGSVFRTTQSLAGKVVDLKPDWNDEYLHSVFRSGKPFVVPIKTVGI